MTNFTLLPTIELGPFGPATRIRMMSTSARRIPPLFVTTTSAMSYTAPTLSAGATYYWKVVANGSVSSTVRSFTTQSVVPAGLQYYPVTPCRVADTRSYGGMTGPSGPPSMTAGSSRSFPVSGSCGIPANAVAYPLNITAVPQTGYLGWLTTWPTGQQRPVASTLNSWNGVIVANAAIVPAGTGGAISVFVSDPSDVFVDVNGYFAPPASDGLQFYPITPCRVADTRSYGGKTGASGPPSMASGTSRAFPVVAASCGIPSTAVAYALNMTAVPLTNYFGWLTAWPTGKPMPVASTLNSWDGTIVANAAIVPAGTGGSISVFASDPADVFFDINGYFAPPAASGLDFYPVNPCRIADTRAYVSMMGPFGAPSMAAGGSRDFPVLSSTCGTPSSAAAYALNVTAVPTTPYLGWLTTWPTAQSKPVASTLNSWNGVIRANAALVPAGTAGSVSVFVSDPAEVFFDINGYFSR